MATVLRLGLAGLGCDKGCGLQAGRGGDDKESVTEGSESGFKGKRQVERF